MTSDNTIISPPVNSRYYHVALIFTVILAMGIRLSAINRLVRLDEARNMHQFAQREPAGFLFDFSDTNNHFLNTLMLHIEYRLLGNDEDWKIRFHVFVIGILVTIATYYTGKELYDADVGIMASALSSVMYLLVEFSINARGYIIMTLIYLVLLILINRMKTQANRQGWILIALLSTLGFLVSLAFLYAMGTLVVWATVSILIENKGQLRRRIFAYFAASMIVGALLTAMYYLLAIVVTYASWAEFKTSYVAQLAQPLEYQQLLHVTIPKAVRVVFELTHIGMDSILIMMCGLGFFIATVFHHRLSKHRFPLIVAIVAWLSIQLLVQRSDIFERVFTFLTPVYAILIAVGLIALVRFITRYRIARFYIAITLSVMMCVPITYQLISQQILPHTWITGYMPNADGIAQSIQDLLKPEDYILSQFTTGKILEYYFWRNKSDIQVEIGSLLDEAYVMEWQLGGTRYVVDKPNITLSSLMLQWNNIATEDMFTFQPMTELSDNLFLYSLTIPPNLPVISNIDDVEKYWFVNNQHVSYQLDNEGVLTFDMFGDQWKLFRYRHGRYFHDYRLSMRVKIIEISDDFEDLLIHFRENDESYYSLAVKANDESGNGFLGLRLDVDGLFQGYFSTTIAQVNTNQWIDITIDIKGNTFTAYLNDEQVLQGDDSLLGSGTISFIAPYDSKVQVSNVRID